MPAPARRPATVAVVGLELAIALVAGGSRLRTPQRR